MERWNLERKGRGKGEMERKRFEESDGIERGVEEEGILKSQGEKERKKERETDCPRI